MTEIPKQTHKEKSSQKNQSTLQINQESLQKEWFDDPYVPPNVKNNHLINIYRPVGVNTIQPSSNPSHDISGTPPKPKLAVSPWQNPSYEPDMDIKNQSLCY